MKSKTNISSFFHFMRPYRLLFAMGFVFLLLSSATSMAFPYLIGQLFDFNEGKKAAGFDFFGVDKIENVVALLFLVFASQALFSFFRIYFFGRVTEGTLLHFRQAVLDRLLLAKKSFFDENKVGELNSRLSNDINQIQETLNTTLAEFIRQIIVIIIGIAAIFVLSHTLALIMLATIPVIALVAVFFGRYIKSLSKYLQKESASSLQIVEEALAGIVNVKIFNNEKYESDRYKTSLDGLYKVAMKRVLWRGAFVSFIILCMFGAIVFVIWQGVLMVQSGEMPLSDFVSFIMFTIFLGASIGSVPDLYAKIQKTIGATQELIALLDTPIEKSMASTTTIPTEIDIEFKMVRFSYQTRKDVEVLKDLNFKLSAGETLALVGPSGSGKSTIASIIMGFYTCTHGGVYLKDQELKNLDMQAWRKCIGLVPQEVFLFSGSIKDNIAYGNTSASDDQLIETAKQANAWEFIERFPDGMNTLVGDRGVQLSGGQKQRIAVARAMLKNPKLLILDEATSSLDSESEQKVQQALDRLRKGRTTLIIAHRLSTLKGADRILVLDKGEIVEQGSHKELMESKSGVYRNLHEIQFEGA